MKYYVTDNNKNIIKMTDLLTSLSQYSLPENILEQIKLLTNKVNLLENKEKSTEYFKNKVKTIFSFVKYLDNINNNSCKIYGSFVRQYIEHSYININDEKYGNIYNHDVDIAVFNNIYGDIYDNNDEYKMYCIQYKYLLTILRTLDDTINFNEYIIHEINDKTKNIPHNEIILLNKNNQDKIKIDLLAFNFIHKCDKCDCDNCNNKNSDFDINNMYMTRKGVSLQDKVNFYEIQENIINKTAISYYPMQLLNDNLQKSMDRKEKAIIYNHFIKFITFRTKIYLNGYNKIIADKICKLYKIEVETKENCPIIDAEPPYINLHLQCSHIISLMAFAQIVNIRSSEFSESILCPYCRSNLIPLVTEDELIINNNILMSPENMSIISGILQGKLLDEINESHDNGILFVQPVVYIDNNFNDDINDINDINDNDNNDIINDIINDNNYIDLENDDDETIIRNMQQIIDNLSPHQTAEIYLNYLNNNQINVINEINEINENNQINDINDINDINYINDLDD
jgi:hypothetical protein